MIEDDDIDEILRLTDEAGGEVVTEMPKLPYGKVRQRRVRVGPLEDIHDVRHEASRLYRALRTADGSDPMLLVTAPHVIRALKLVLDAVKNVELEEQIINIRRMLEGKKPLVPKSNKRRGVNGVEYHA